MGKATKQRQPVAKRGKREPANDMADINAFTAQHGDYVARGKYSGAAKMLVNRGGTPRARWEKAGMLSETQISAIDHCERLWSQINGKGLVANWDAVPGGSSGDGWSEQEALTSLARMKSYVPPKYWSVFECVCRFDEPAGFAGSRLTDCLADQVATARLTVQFVADIVYMKERLSY